jgi:hypothetical protein
MPVSREDLRGKYYITQLGQSVHLLYHEAKNPSSILIFNKTQILIPLLQGNPTCLAQYTARLCGIFIIEKQNQ